LREGLGCCHSSGGTSRGVNWRFAGVFSWGASAGLQTGGNKWWVEVSKMVKHSGLSVENCGSNGGSAVKQLQTNVFSDDFNFKHIAR